MRSDSAAAEVNSEQALGPPRVPMLAARPSPSKHDSTTQAAPETSSSPGLGLGARPRLLGPRVFGVRSTRPVAL